jgi:hypothetical protein
MLAYIFFQESHLLYCITVNIPYCWRVFAQNFSKAIIWKASAVYHVCNQYYDNITLFTQVHCIYTKLINSATGHVQWYQYE